MVTERGRVIPVSGAATRFKYLGLQARCFEYIGCFLISGSPENIHMPSRNNWIRQFAEIYAVGIQHAKYVLISQSFRVNIVMINYRYRKQELNKAVSSLSNKYLMQVLCNIKLDKPGFNMELYKKPIVNLQCKRTGHFFTGKNDLLLQ